MRITKCEMTQTEQMPLEQMVSTDLLQAGLPQTCYLKKKKNPCVQSAIKQDMPVLFQRWQMFNIYLIKNIKTFKVWGKQSREYDT